MWTQSYTFAGGSLPLSVLLAALPIVVLLLSIGIFKLTAARASLLGLISAFLVAVLGCRMPIPLALSAAAYGGAFGFFPIFWIVYWAIVLYRMTLEAGKLEVLKSSIGRVASDRGIQVLFIAFSFGAFLEGAAGFGTPVAVAASILAGLGLSPFYAAALCLISNTAPVAFGSIGIPLVTLTATTGLPLDALSANTGRLVAPISLFIPTYLVLIMGGRKELRRLWPASLVCGASFATAQLLTSNLAGPYLTDIVSSLSSMVAMMLLLRVWKPRAVATETKIMHPRYSSREILLAWSPYLLLVFFILLWGSYPLKPLLDRATFFIGWPLLHCEVIQLPPVVTQAKAYAAVYKVDWLSAAGTACAFSVVAAAFVLRISARQLLRICGDAAHQLRGAFASFVFVLALAFLMNYAGLTATLGLAFSEAGRAFPFFSALLGWTGVFLTGSDTSANALFGNLQTITATRLGYSPSLLASANSAGGVMGKMISLQSIAVAAAATGLLRSDEPKLFRFTLKHSAFLAILVGLLTMFYTYVAPSWIR